MKILLGPKYFWTAKLSRPA